MYIKFLISLLKHKWYVFLAGIRVGVPVWQLIIHDWQKFTPAEFGAYARYCSGKVSINDTKDARLDYTRAWLDFTHAWLHHENSARHHWGHWIPRTGNHAGKPLKMPRRYVKEMVADMMGASKTYTGSWNMSVWLNDNGPKFKLHPKTSDCFHDVLLELGYVNTDNCPWSYTLVNY